MALQVQRWCTTCNPDGISDEEAARDDFAGGADFALGADFAGGAEGATTDAAGVDAGDADRDTVRSPSRFPS